MSNVTITDMTAVETITGDCLFVNQYDESREIEFLDTDDRRIRTFSYDQFAEVREALAIDLGAGVVISAETVSVLQAWANIDAFGMGLRAAI